MVFKTFIVIKAPKTFLEGAVNRFLNFTHMPCQIILCRAFASAICAGLGVLMSPPLAFPSVL